MVGTRVYILARRRMNIERNKYRVYYRILCIENSSCRECLSLSRATDQTRANPSESEWIRVRLDCRRYRSTILHLCDEKWWRRKRSRNRVINSIHIVRRYSWTASTQTHSRPAHKDLRENGEHGGGARNSKSVLVTCAKERLVFSSIKETLHTRIRSWIHSRDLRETNEFSPANILHASRRHRSIVKRSNSFLRSAIRTYCSIYLKPLLRCVLETNNFSPPFNLHQYTTFWLP